MILGLFGNIGTPELLLIGFIVLLLFGGKKLPELMQGLGKGVRGFKKGLNDVKEEIDRPVDTPDDNEQTK